MGNLANIGQLVIDRLPFLSKTDNSAIIQRRILECFYELQGQTGVSDEEVEIEASYTPAQRIFFAAYTAYKLLNQRIMLGLAGSDIVEATGNQVVKKAVLDVLEAEFEVLKARDVALGIDTVKLLEFTSKEVCSLANNVDIELAFCGYYPTQTTPFIFVPN